MFKKLWKTQKKAASKMQVCLHFCIMRDLQLKSARDAKILNKYNEIANKHPQWRHDAIIDELVKEFFLKAGTIAKIVSASKE